MNLFSHLIIAKEIIDMKSEVNNLWLEVKLNLKEMIYVESQYVSSEEEDRWAYLKESILMYLW